jgi:ATP synthase protein I
MDQNSDKQRGPVDNSKVDSSEVWRAFGLVSAIGADMAACTIGGAFLGWWLDKVCGTRPWLLLAGIVIGLAAGILGIFKLLEALGPGKKKA